MEDPCEAVAALGLQAVALLCEDDVLEFYAAWRVVHKAFPKMPSQVGGAIGIVMVVIQTCSCSLNTDHGSLSHVLSFWPGE